MMDGGEVQGTTTSIDEEGTTGVTSTAGRNAQKNAFKPVHKKFKSKACASFAADALDPLNADHADLFQRISVSLPVSGCCSRAGGTCELHAPPSRLLRPLSDLQVFEINGVILFKDVFTCKGQEELLRAAVVDCLSPANKCNLDAHHARNVLHPDEAGSLFDRYSTLHHGSRADAADAAEELQAAHEAAREDEGSPKAKAPKTTHRRHPSLKPSATQPKTHGETDAPPQLDPASSPTFLEKLRWVTVGHQYDWNAKVYPAGAFTPVHPLLSSVCEYLAMLAGVSFTADAGIINFYTKSSSLGPHTDHSEQLKAAPLVSVSLSLPCVYLTGGLTLEEPPVPLLLESGDAVLMHGTMRQAYHSVPRILSLDDYQLYFAKEYTKLPCTLFPRADDKCHRCSNKQKSSHQESTGNISSEVHRPPPSLPATVRVQPQHHDCTISAPSKNPGSSSSALSEAARIALATFLAQRRVNVNLRQHLPCTNP